MTKEDEARVLKKLVIGSIISEYALMELMTNSKQDLKQRVKVGINACRNVQSWFQNNPNSKKEHIEIFKKEFLKNEMLLIGELLESIWGLSEDDLELIINSIKDNTDAIEA